MTSEPNRTARTRPEPALPEGTNTEALHRRINGWFLDQARDLPWRRDECTPWGVMVSEFMLQQTPVKRVLPVWEEWMRRWPTPADLAAEPASEAVRAWGRLGYPRRAQRLHSAAVAIVEQHGGEVPADYEALLALPGVGSYTAAAISVFAFGLRATVIDTNIRRVHARAVSGKALPSRSLTAAETRLAEALMPADTPHLLPVECGDHGARRAGLHGKVPDLRAVPGGESVRLGCGGQAGGGLHPQGSELARHGPPGARGGHGGVACGA